MVVKKVKNFPSFMNCWRQCGLDNNSEFKRWEEVEEQYKFKFVLGTTIYSSQVEFESEEHYTMFVLRWT